MMYIVISRNELMHHGVKGMKWGVRKEKPTSNKQRRSLKQIASDHPYITAGVAITTALLLTHGGRNIYNLYKEGYFNKRYDPSDILKALPTSTSFDMKVINDIPGLSKSITDGISKGAINLQSCSDRDQKAFNTAMKNGWFTNCVHCTNAAALRKKGYDVVATNSMTGHNTGDVLKWWNGSKISRVRDSISSDIDRRKQIDELERMFRSQGVGSYGDFHIKNLFSGHSVQYSVGKNGITINDFQVRRTYSSLKDFFDSYGSYNPSNSEFIRLDNCKPNLEQMLKDRIIKPRG